MVVLLERGSVELLTPQFWKYPTLIHFKGSVLFFLLSDRSLLSPESWVFPTVILPYSSQISHSPHSHDKFNEQSFLLHITYELPQLPTTNSANQPLSSFILCLFPFVSVKEVSLCLSKANHFPYVLEPSRSHFSREPMLFAYLLSLLCLRYLPLLALSPQILDVLKILPF